MLIGLFFPAVLPLASAGAIALVGATVSFSMEPNGRLLLAGAVGCVISLAWGNRQFSMNRLALIFATLGCSLTWHGMADLRAIGVLLSMSALPVGGIMQFSPPQAAAEWMRRAVQFLAIGFVFGSLAIAFSTSRTQTANRIGYLEHGAWARATPELLDAVHPTIANMYSSSELVETLAAECQQTANSEWLSGLGELWIVTPTTPFSADELLPIARWVGDGGHIILVGDHTDLYGHASVLNQLAQLASCQIDTGAVFELHSAQHAETPFGASIGLKTSTRIVSTLGWPMLSSIGWIERADYGGRNFFGDLRPSLDDWRARTVVCTARSYGRGLITLVADSTPIANFAIFQRSSQQLLGLVRQKPWGATLWPIVVLGCFAAVPVVVLVRGTKVMSLLVGPLLFATFSETPAAIPTRHRTLSVAGDVRAAHEDTDPKQTVSTILALLPAFGWHCQWTDSPAETRAGLWLGSKKTAPAGWMVLDFECPEIELTPGYCTLPESILERIGFKATPGLPTEPIKDRAINPTGLWTNFECGDWWVSSGLSPSRRDRLRSFAMWATQSEDKLIQIYDHKQLQSAPEESTWTVSINGAQHTVRCALPQPTLGQYRAFGGGISGYGVSIDGFPAYVFRKEMQEQWNAPVSWYLMKTPPTEQTK